MVQICGEPWRLDTKAIWPLGPQAGLTSMLGIVGQTTHVAAVGAGAVDLGVSVAVELNTTRPPQLATPMFRPLRLDDRAIAGARSGDEHAGRREHRVPDAARSEGRQHGDAATTGTRPRLAPSKSDTKTSFLPGPSRRANVMRVPKAAAIAREQLRRSSLSEVVHELAQVAGAARVGFLERGLGAACGSRRSAW